MKQKIQRHLVKVLTQLLLILTTWANTTYAQVTCSGGTTNIPRSGSVTVNGVTVSTTYTGDVQSYSPTYPVCNVTTMSANSLLVGRGFQASPATPSPWSITLSFNQPVNNLVILLGATGSGYDPRLNENFIFNSNGGTVSIAAGSNCYSMISGNTIYSGANAPVHELSGGGGLFRITSPSAYTRLTISGDGGLDGSLMAICGLSIKSACNIATPTVTVTAGSLAICNGDSVTLRSSASSGNQWYRNGVSISGATGQTYTTSTAGTYTVIVTTAGCSSSASAGRTVTLTTVATPTVSASGSLSFCNGGSVTLTSSASSGNQWYKDGVLISGATNRTYVVATAGTYTVVVTTNGCSSSASAGSTVTITNVATPTVSASGPLSFCNGGSVTLTSSATSGNQWYKDGVLISGATNRTYVATTAGTYTVAVTSSGCSSSSNGINVSVLALATPLVKSSLDNICPATSVNLNSAHTGATPNGANLVWFNNSNHTGTPFSTAEVAQATAGTYYAFYYNSTGGCYSNASNSVVVTINSCEPTCPVENLKPSVKDLANSCPSVTVDLSDAHTGAIPGASSIRWFTNNSHSGAPLSDAQVTEAEAGTYYAFYYENGCYSLASNPVNVTIGVCNPSSGADLTIGIRANPATINIGGKCSVTYTFSNIGTGATNGSTITYFIYKPQAGTLTIGTLNQSGWTVTETATGYFITSNKIVQTGLANALIMNTNYTHNGSNENALYNVDAMVINGSGGETNLNNNQTTTLLKIN